MTKTPITLSRGTRTRIAQEYIVADTPELAEIIHQSILQGLTTPGYDQYGGATITLASDGAGTKYVAFCAKRLSDSIFGFYIINLATMQALPYSPFCTGRGSISNAGFWIAWKDKDFWWGVIPGFQGYLDYGALINALTARVAALESQNAELASRVTALEQRPTGTGGELTDRERKALDLLLGWFAPLLPA